MQAGPLSILIFLNTGRMLVWEEKSGRIVGEDSTVATPAPSEYFRTAWLQADKGAPAYLRQPYGRIYFTSIIYIRASGKKYLREKPLMILKNAKTAVFGWVATKRSSNFPHVLNCYKKPTVWN